MRITYRQAENKEYWAERWASVGVDKPMENRNSYPLKYAELTVSSREGTILEAGCGAGRILRYFHDRGFDIIGIDFVEGPITKLKNADPTLKVEVGDITKLRFEDGRFRYVLAFGLLHNLEHGLEQAISETHRVLQKDGLVCASFRADNVQTRITDWLAQRRLRQRVPGRKSFHKMNLTRDEFSRLFTRAGFGLEKFYPVENMPIFYKFSFFRAREHKKFDETKARAEGYRLSAFGQMLQNALIRFFPDEFCNIYVIVARKVTP